MPTNYRDLDEATDIGKGTEWDDDWNTLVQSVDVELVPSGPSSERPSSPSVSEDTLWYVTTDDAGASGAADETLTRYDQSNDEWNVVEAEPKEHDNAAHSETFTTADEDVENFATSGADGTVPTSQGDGTLSMETVSGGPQIEIRTPYAISVGPASDDGWDTYEENTTSISFNTSFDSTPFVVAAHESDEPGTIVKAVDVSQSSFTLVVRNYSTTDYSGGPSTGVRYIAIAP